MCKRRRSWAGAGFYPSLSISHFLAGRKTMGTQSSSMDKTFAYRVLRYTPNLVRDEWVNIGVLVFDPQSGERRMRLIEDPEEYARVRRLHPRADEELLRALRDDLENRFATATQLFKDRKSTRLNSSHSQI